MYFEHVLNGGYLIIVESWPSLVAGDGSRVRSSQASSFAGYGSTFYSMADLVVRNSKSGLFI